MNEAARQLLEKHDLQPHPEGGWYRELHRSPLQLKRNDGHQRAALTAILFLLCEGELSRWHRVQQADEVWVHCAGASLTLWSCHPETLKTERHELDGKDPVRVITAGRWQAAQSNGAFSFVCCCVGPGFDFEDFELARECPEDQRPQLPYPELA